MEASVKGVKGIKAALACALAMSVFALGGCASNSTENATNPGFEATDIEIQQSGYTIGDDGTLRYAFVAVNPNEGHLAQNVAFSMEAYDSDNRIVAGAGVTMPLMYPGEELAASGTAEVFKSTAATAGANSGSNAGGIISSAGATTGSTATGSTGDQAAQPQIAYIQITPMMDSIEWSDTTYDKAKLEEEIVFEGATSTKGESNNLGITAQVSTTLESVSLSAVAIVFDGEGNPICGSEVAEFDCTKDEAAQVSLDIPNVPEYTECFVYISPLTAL